LTVVDAEGTAARGTTEPGLEGFEFDRATAVEPAGDGRWRAEIRPEWTVGLAPNGGYVLAVALAALSRSLPHPDPFAVSAHFVSKTDPGPADVVVEVVRTGVGVSTGTARLVQGRRTRALVTGTYGDLSAIEGPTAVRGEPPDVPPPDACVKVEGPATPEFVKRFDLRLTDESVAWARTAPSGVAEMLGWIRFVDGRPPDSASLPMFADAFPPSSFNVVPSLWVPTLELTVHVRARPSPGWLRCRFQTRYLIDGYLEEDGELWDEGGRLVALSRQMARIQT